MTGEDFKPRHILICPDSSSCQIQTDGAVKLILLPVNECQVCDKVCLHFALKRGNHVKPGVFVVGDVLGPCDQLILSFHHNINESAAAVGLKEYISMLTKDGRAEVMDDFINLFSDKKNHCAVSFIGKECYEVVLAMQKFISKI